MTFMTTVTFHVSVMSSTSNQSFKTTTLRPCVVVHMNKAPTYEHFTTRVIPVSKGALWAFFTNGRSGIMPNNAASMIT
ncbi:hypothetical protein HanRHA438_Chr17g0841181 [Helianthus annuus]|nr:hypothetical protein HanRHA438_Chr17g0841181 [Helianthus annuus]